MLISVAIPAYNRANLLAELLDSIARQLSAQSEILICEDASPERSEIRKVVSFYQARHPGKISYYENEKNLGYDGNLRSLIEKAEGEYILFMGNDDLLANNALEEVTRAVGSYPDVGVVLRSYTSFHSSPARPVQTFRYFDGERFFPAGAESIITFFRRSVFISGMVLRRDSALARATSRFDGTLLYQQYLVGQILAERNGVFLPQILSHHRLGGIPDFGNSPKEKGLFVPREQTPESSLAFMRGMLSIAADLERTLGLRLYNPILSDLGNYAFPFIAIQASRPKPVFIRYITGLLTMGFWRIPMFYVYSFALLLLGEVNCNRIIQTIKKAKGNTPVIGKVFSGRR